MCYGYVDHGLIKVSHTPSMDGAALFRLWQGKMALCNRILRRLPSGDPLASIVASQQPTSSLPQPMPQPVVQVDAFTDRPFAGNPAAVCILERSRDAEWMQRVALEMNLSETAFLVPAADGYDLRWFTPEVEIDLCGHATLASAHVLWQDGHLAPDAEARFHTRSGLLTCRRDGDWIWMDF